MYDEHTQPWISVGLPSAHLENDRYVSKRRSTSLKQFIKENI